MESLQKPDNRVFMFYSKKNINDAIQKNDYKHAFAQFVLVLERLDDSHKNVLIDYYSKKIYKDAYVNFLTRA